VSDQSGALAPRRAPAPGNNAGVGPGSAPAAGRGALRGAGADLGAEIARRAPPPRLDALARMVAPAVARRSRRGVTAPFTGREFGWVPWLEPEDVVAAAARGRAAQPAWAALPWRRRVEVVLRFHDRVLARHDEVVDLVQVESGKTRFHAFAELIDVALVARYYAYRGEGLLATRRRRGTFPVVTAAWERRVPRGLVGIISTWNYPLTIAISDALPALLAGNAVLLKPDERTPFTALWCLEQLRAAGLPPDVFQVVTGAGAALGEAVVDTADFVDFTGSTAVGRKVAARAANRLSGCALELGGKNALIVLDDADLDATVEGAVQACFTTAGQLCVASEAIHVHRSLYDEFRRRFVARVRRMRLGASFEFGIDMGSLVSAAQLARVQEHVAEALAGGARLLIGGRPRPELGPFFHEPTVLEGVVPGMRAHDEETFGPVVGLHPFDDEGDVVRLLNASPFGLHASVWTRSVRHGRALAARLRVGMVAINDAWGSTWGSVDAPMGGMKASGLGHRHGSDGIRKYTESQTVAVQRLLPLATPPGRERFFYRLAMAYLRVARHVPGLR
jgi:succinate-semialdehyde dehydrogenase / glutarate-semialdehyde dehydrogenase